MRQLAVLVAIVRKGSMTRAAEELGLSKSVVSAHLRSLEETMGVRLLERTTRRMRLTQVGERVVEAAARMVEAAEEAFEAAAEEVSEVTGVLRVSVPVDLSRSLLMPALSSVRRAHPDLRIEVEVSDRPLDLLDAGVDVALRIGVAESSDHVMRTLAMDEEILVAAPALVEEHPRERPSELLDLPWLAHIVVHHDAQTWFRGEETEEIVVRPSVLVASTDVLRRMALDALGVLRVPSHIVADELASGSLVRVAPGWRHRVVRLYALMPSKVHSRRVRVFLDAVQAVVDRRFPTHR